MNRLRSRRRVVIISAAPPRPHASPGLHALLRLLGLACLGLLFDLALRADEPEPGQMLPIHGFAHERPLLLEDHGVSTDDFRIVLDVHHALAKDSTLAAAARKLKITCDAGFVTLSGPVASADELAQILKAAKAVRGVRRVTNHLAIAESPAEKQQYTTR